MLRNKVSSHQQYMYMYIETFIKMFLSIHNLMYYLWLMFCKNNAKNMITLHSKIILNKTPLCTCMLYMRIKLIVFLYVNLEDGKNNVVGCSFA